MILLKKDRLIKAIASETGDANVIACLDEYGNTLSAKGGGVLLDLSRGFTLARVGKGSSTSYSTDVEGLRELIRKAARAQDLLARATSLISTDGRFSVVDSPFSNTVWVSLWATRGICLRAEFRSRWTWTSPIPSSSVNAWRRTSRQDER